MVIGLTSTRRNGRAWPFRRQSSYCRWTRILSIPTVPASGRGGAARQLQPAIGRAVGPGLIAAGDGSAVGGGLERQIVEVAAQVQREQRTPWRGEGAVELAADAHQHELSTDVRSPGRARQKLERLAAVVAGGSQLAAKVAGEGTDGRQVARLRAQGRHHRFARLQI